MEEKSGKEVHIIVNTLSIVKLLNKTSEHFEKEPLLIPLIFGDNVERGAFQIGSICAAFYMLFVLCKENNYYSEDCLKQINSIMSKANVIEPLNGTVKPILRNLRNAIAHGDVEPLGNNQFSFIDENKKRKVKLVFTLSAQDLTDIMNIAIKDLSKKINN
jgi:hypothetical protein